LAGAFPALEFLSGLAAASVPEATAFAVFADRIVACATMVERSGVAEFFSDVAFAGSPAYFSGAAVAVVAESEGVMDTEVLGAAEAWIVALTIMAVRLEPEESGAVLLFPGGFAWDDGAAGSDGAASAVLANVGAEGVACFGLAWLGVKIAGMGSLPFSAGAGEVRELCGKIPANVLMIF